MTIRTLLLEPQATEVQVGDTALLERWLQDRRGTLWLDLGGEEPEVEERLLSRFEFDELSIQDLDATIDKLVEKANDAWQRREKELGTDEMRAIEHFLMLNAIDARWKDHLHAMDGLKAGISMRSWGQMDPKVEYKVEGHKMFRSMMHGIREEVTDHLVKVRFSRQAEEELSGRWSDAEAVAPPEQGTGVDLSAPPPSAGRTDDSPIGSTPSGPAQPIKRDMPKVGRNDPCPCGSGKKYKKCHGAAEA